MKRGLAGLVLGLFAAGCSAPQRIGMQQYQINPNLKSCYERIFEAKDYALSVNPELKAFVLSKGENGYSLRVELDSNEIIGIRLIHGDYVLDSYGLNGQLHYVRDDAKNISYGIHKQGEPIVPKIKPIFSGKPEPDTVEFFEDMFEKGVHAICDYDGKPFGVIPIPRSNVLVIPDEAKPSSRP